ncbi:hypothetical protein PHLGIDRAFT_412969 [Phlebiopsis gigantea 11061_1 CR5-6]|uniref:DUF6533 domain-containing protein n=1 Tax=Phlebiopsis gigantea (strain 11061_1 CR5-6) TaxID=745531 RepID=A0A0C3PLY5_PHLG1|nr:hypothetical protein PHLGIDRAFT_412969 [Phlebiopsis gigantea 11061_1 CR5-6]
MPHLAKHAALLQSSVNSSVAAKCVSMDCSTKLRSPSLVEVLALHGVVTDHTQSVSSNAMNYCSSKFITDVIVMLKYRTTHDYDWKACPAHMPLTLLEQTRIDNYLSLAGFVLNLYDYALTFPVEYAYIWRGRRRISAILFWVLRYMNLILSLTDLVILFVPFLAIQLLQIHPFP